MQPRPKRRHWSVPLSFVFFTLTFLLAPIFLGPLQAQVVSGRLLDNESRRPVVNGTVTLADSLGRSVARVLTDSDGQFTVRAPQPGRYTLRGWGLGYRGGLQPRFDLGEGEEITTDLYLVPDPLVMDPLEVSAERVRSELERQGFYERMAKRRGFFLTPSHLKTRPPITEAEVIARAPFVEIDRSWTGSRVLMLSGGRRCRPDILVDNFGVTGEHLEDNVNFADIVALEVYRGSAEIPYELAVGFSGCGVIMIWTVWSQLRSKKAGGGVE